MVNEVKSKYHISLNRKISIYLYPQEIAQSEIGTINGGFYNLLTNKVHNVLSTPFYYPKTDNYSLLGDHETVHALFLNSFGISNSQLMVEGIAVAIDKGYGNELRNGKNIRKSIFDIVRFQRDNNQLLSIKDLCTDNGAECLFYPQAGVFIEWLINTYGIDTYKNVYRNTYKKMINQTKKYFGISIEQLELNYHNYLLTL